jgi:DNA-binding NarL/FixJ family response regulator
MTIRVLISDDQALVRAGFRKILDSEPGIEVVAEAADGIEATDLADYVFEALRAGASGFLVKDAPPEHLVAAVDTVAAGEALLDPAVTRAVIDEFVRRSPAAPRPGTELTN